MGRRACELCGYCGEPGFTEECHIIPVEITRQAGAPESSTVTCPYESCELCPDAKVCATRYFITAGIEESGRAAAGGAVNPSQGTRWTRLLLNDDGQSLEISFWDCFRWVSRWPKRNFVSVAM